MRILISLMLIICLYSVNWACECLHNWQWPIEEELEVTELVFIGTVVEIVETKESGSCDFYEPSIAYKYIVSKVFKGIAELDSVLIFTSLSDCGYFFELGKNYLLYAGSGSCGKYSTDVCTRTTAKVEEGTALVRKHLSKE